MFKCMFLSKDQALRALDWQKRLFQNYKENPRALDISSRILESVIIFKYLAMGKNKQQKQNQLLV